MSHEAAVSPVAACADGHRRGQHTARVRLMCAHVLVSHLRPFYYDERKKRRYLSISLYNIIRHHSEPGRIHRQHFDKRIR